MNTILPIDVESSTIAKLRAIYGKSANIQQGYIRLEKVLTQSSTSETFTLGEGRSNGTKRPLENFLSQSDNFVPVYFRCGIQKQWNIDTAGPSPVGLNGNNGNQPVYTYPDLNVFNRAGVAPSLSEAQALEGVWSGNISMKSNTYEVVNKMSLTRNRRAPQTQFALDNVNFPTTQASSGDIFEGYVKLPIVPIFEGKKRNEIIFSFAQGADATEIGVGANVYGETEVTTENILVLDFWGFLVRNASEPASYSELTRDGIIL
jgi:hypothetical protein